MSKDKGKAIFGLEKIPTKALLKMSIIEIGKLKSYIDELEYENNKLRKKLDNITSLSSQEQKALRKELMKEKLYKEQAKELKDSRIKVNTLKRDLEREMCKRLQLTQNQK